MAACYSSTASAPLHVLANQFLGESSTSTKTSLFRPSNHQHHSSQQQQQEHQKSAGLFPRHYDQLPASPLLQSPQHHKYVDKVSDLFEQAWSTSASIPPSLSSSSSGQWSAQVVQPRPLYQRHLPDLDLISSWEYAVQGKTAFNPQQQHHESTVVSGVMAVAAGPGEYSMAEFEAFHYSPSPQQQQTTTSEADLAKNDSAWAQEMVQREKEEDEVDEDEFREEWSNDACTQAYIDSHQQQFRRIEEQEELKEARLAEQRERQRVASGGPPRSAWMMAGSMSATATVAGTGKRRLKVPGLDEHSIPVDDHFSVDEFTQFIHGHGRDPWDTTTEQQRQQPRPIKAEDRFLSLVSDLNLAEQIYYPGASSATLTEQEQDKSLSDPTWRPTQASSTGGWAQEFAVDNLLQRQRHLGAEWNWEKLFGKDPRKALQLATEASKASAAAAGDMSEMEEHERLKTVALARLQALFAHLSLTMTS
ncbi:hypothetical protein BGX28_009777 [Mortierella sp. GBA30]|nr:hypothetical protein BGX28_009777 [Mortierella sp. GBA30]